MDISPAKSIEVFLRNGSAIDTKRLESYRPYLQKLAKLKDITLLTAGQEVPASATQLHGDLEILVPLAGLIDVAAERTRLEKEIAKLEGLLKAVSGKLANAKFVDNAPADVVEKEQAKQQQMTTAIAALQDKLTQLAAL